ncbi:hypothetical protein F2P81_006370 [Scophthalmus maximus]|uniref:Uncharacterized protein n=1 Tax=Scophthalmus maximus TaxID=52904 RepID=A0A6A4TDX7_SCOMX|nr:hypothetical protein F2P81_006370 [Scophthalmus maximus]
MILQLCYLDFYPQLQLHCRLTRWMHPGHSSSPPLKSAAIVSYRDTTRWTVRTHTRTHWDPETAVGAEWILTKCRGDISLNVTPRREHNQ